MCWHQESERNRIRATSNKAGLAEIESEITKKEGYAKAINAEVFKLGIEKVALENLVRTYNTEQTVETEDNSVTDLLNNTIKTIKQSQQFLATNALQSKLKITI